MSIDILVPPLSQTMDTLFLTRWEKKAGDPVTKGEVLFIVETDKATLEVESPGTGILGEILVEAGSEVPVRSKIGSILDADELDHRQDTDHATAGTQEEPQSPSIPDALPAGRSGRIFASPRARRLANSVQRAGRFRIDLDQIQPSGPRNMVVERDIYAFLEQRQKAPKITPLARRAADEAGLDLDALIQGKSGKRITRKDVDQALADLRSEAAVEESKSEDKSWNDAPVSPGRAETTQGRPDRKAGRRVSLTYMRKTISRRMQESHLTTAPVTLMREVDATELKRLREQILQEIDLQDVRPTYTDFVISIVARCLLQHPDLNGTFDGETLELQDEVHMGLAVDTESGLLVPVIRSAHKKGIGELARERQELVNRALGSAPAAASAPDAFGALTPGELTGGTFTITNMGGQGIDLFTPMINLPQIAILGLGRIHPSPAVVDGQILVRELMGLSLTFDHRVVDGGPASRFLLDVVRLIEKPYRIWI